VSSTLVDVAGELGVGYVAMHRQGDSTVMQVKPTYDDVVGEIAQFLTSMAKRAKLAASPPCGSIRVSDLARRPSTTSRSWPTCRTSWRSRATSTPGS